jgi:general L-amino acid transport system substrate-binding protein
MHIFISYAHVDWQFVDKLANRLRRYHDVWFDEHLLAGQDWWQAILEQLDRCECFIYALSPESLASKYCRDEYDEAQNSGKHIIPIRLQPNIELPDTLQRIQYADFSARRFEDALADLIGDLGRLELQVKAQGLPLPAQRRQPAISPLPKEQRDHSAAFREAVEARQAGDHETALRLFNTLAQTAPDFLPEQIAGLIQDSQAELERQARRKEYDRQYKQVTLLALDHFTVGNAEQMWEELLNNFPEINDDPEQLTAFFQYQRKARAEAEERRRQEAERAQREAEEERARLEAAEREQQQLEDAQRDREVAPSTPPPIRRQKTVTPDPLVANKPVPSGLNPLWIVGGVIGVGLLVGILALSGVLGGGPPAEEEPQPTESATPAVEEAPVAEEEMTEEGPAMQEGTSTLDEVIARGTLKCGVNTELFGFGYLDNTGRNVGFDTEFCRAIAAAVLGDGEAVEFTSLNADQRFPALQTGEVDVLIRITTWTLTRDADLGLDFTVTTFYDGQGYMVRKSEFNSVEELDGGTICVTSGTTTEANLADDFAARGLTYTPNAFSETSDTHSAFVDGACDAETSYTKYLLASLRAASANPEDYIILPDTISKEPFGPVVRANDSDWRDAVVWTVFAMIEAERLGINQANVDTFMDSDDIQVQRLLGTGEDDLGGLLGLPKDFGYQIISQVGNYGDVYDTYLTPIGITRAGSANAHWTEGGLIYAPAFR